MDTGTSNLLSRVIPTAESPNWALFVLVLIVALALSPRAIDAYRKLKYEKLGVERRQPETCAAHAKEIAAMKKRIEAQDKDIAALRLQISESILELRDFIEEKFQQDRTFDQTERKDFEKRILQQIGMMLRLPQGITADIT